MRNAFVRSTGARRACRAAAFAVLGLALAGAALADDVELTDLDLEDLMQLEVTSVSKKAELASEAPAAVYVITGEDIRRSGVRSIPEALRMVPGLHVAQLSGNRWAVSSRGFSSVFSDKLLVLIDGRSVYTPLFAGVYWDVQDTLLEDIDRIEVIRGPGGTLWGANAVNGVINIVTKKAKDTQGIYVNGGGGLTEQGFAEARYGGAIGELGFWRAYGKYYKRDHFEPQGSLPVDDETEQFRGGLRSDWKLFESNDLTLQGDVYSGHSNTILSGTDQATLNPTLVGTNGEVFGANVLARGTHHFSEDSEASLQLYYDRAERDEDLYEYQRDTVDVEFQHRFGLLDFADIVWGGNYRHNRDDIDNSFSIGLAPDGRSFQQAGGFVQAELRFLDEQVRLTGGTKLEYNDFTGFEYQPSGRLAWVPNSHFTLWGAVSRAVRTPSRSNEDALLIYGAVPDPPFPPPPSIELQVIGNGGTTSEELLAYEAGFRAELREQLFLDVTGFYNDYNELTSFELGSLFCTDGTQLSDPPTPGEIFACALGGNRLRQELVYDNKANAKAWGVEAALRIQPTSFWRLDLAYTFFDIDFGLDSDSTATSLQFEEGQTPSHQFNVRSRLNLPCNLFFDTAFFFVDDLPALDVDRYFRVDARLAWRPIEHLEVSVAGLNIAEQHQEFGGQGYFVGTRVPRTIYGALTWRY
jgi:iron complex outermembrane receptor protein